MIFPNLKKQFLLLVVVSTMVGCVGTIEDTELKKTKTIPTDPPPIAFDGIAEVEPVANDKVEIFFFPAPGDALDLAYEVNYDGLEAAISVPAINLRADYRGYLRYLVTDLNSDATYNFEVQAKNLKTKARSSAKKQIAATTFGNITANFLGIQNLSTMPGIAGINSVKVGWAEAEKQGSLIPKEIDPANYEITVLNGDNFTPAEMNNESVSVDDRKIYLIAPEKIAAIVGGLTGDTTYHVQVRAIHHGFNLYGADLNYLREQNTKYLSIKTLSDQLSDLNFDPESLIIALSSGAAGLGSIVANWLPASGAFDHYRLYYNRSAASNLAGYLNPDSICDGQEDNDPDIYCKQVTFDKFSSVLVDLSSNQEYEVMLAVCQSIYCELSKRITSSIRVITTTPNVAQFTGIIDIDPAKFVEKLDYVYLKVVPPALGTGVIDGIIVEYKHPTLGNKPLNHPTTANTSSLNVVSFNYQSDSEYVVSGVNPFSLDPYCFSAFPYTFQGGVVVEHRTNEVVQCILPTIEPPPLANFAGAAGCDDPDIHLNIYWDPAYEGIYSHYEIWVLPSGNGTFDFGSAVGGNPNYIRYLVSKHLTEFTIEAPGVDTYTVGVITYANVDGNIIRSPFNSSIQTCSVNP
jgi:hypothetical protein